jgi:hypothetical protein
VSDNLLLVGNDDFDNGILVSDNGLATQAAFNAGINGAIDEVFLLITDFFQRIFAFIDVDVASAASADFATIVVEVNLILLGHFQDANVYGNVLNRFRGYILVLEGEFYGGHVVV